MITKFTYSQSSDIKSRTFQEYRNDMKKKAIAELDFLPVLEAVLRDRNNDKTLTVEKGGSDSKLWFSQDKKNNSDPDYVAKSKLTGDFRYEFQYTTRNDLKLFDFKEAKVGKKIKKQTRTPYQDREFFYVIQPNKNYGFVSPDWIVKNGKSGPVPAWGNRVAYRVKSEDFSSVINKSNPMVSEACFSVEEKIFLLNFQNIFIQQEIKTFSDFLQQSVDKKEIFKIIPTTILGFFKICLLLDKLQNFPKNIGIWLVYACSFFTNSISSVDLARLTFCIDFLYFANCNDMQPNEFLSLENVVLSAIKHIRDNFQFNGSWIQEFHIAPIESLRAIIFSVNLLEDIIQSLHYVNNSSKISPVKKIFELIPCVPRTADYIQKNASATVQQ